MAEFTEDDVTRLAEMVMCVPLMPALTTDEHMRLARHLLQQGVMLPPPPPDPAVVVAQAIYKGVRGGSRFWEPETIITQANTIAAVRDLFTPEALRDAAAKVQEVARA